MKFLKDIVIKDNVITYSLKADYNNPLTSEEEQEIETMHDYIRKVKLSEIDFVGDVDMSTGMPIVAETATDDTVEVSLGNVAPKEYVVDEKLNIEFSLDVSRIHDAELTDKLNTKVLLGQAKIAVFGAKVEARIKEILEQMRSEDNDFEGVEETVLCGL